MRALPLTIVSLALLAHLAAASPAVRVEALDGVARISLEGTFGPGTYSVFRALAPEGATTPVGVADVLCVGVCFVDDPEARAGGTYWYRFDFRNADGSRVTFGPTAVTIPAILARRVGARIVPNPVHGAATIEIHLAGSGAAGPVAVRVRILDVQGRIVRALDAGDLPRGLSRLAWDGRDRAGRALAPGAYVVTVESPLGAARTRLVRVR